MFRLVSVTILLLVLGTPTEAGILHAPIDVDGSVIENPALDFGSEAESHPQISGILDRDMTGFSDLSRSAKSMSSVGIIDAPAFSTPAHFEIVGMTNQLPPCDPCRSGLLRPPQDLS